MCNQLVMITHSLVMITHSLVIVIVIVIVIGKLEHDSIGNGNRPLVHLGVNYIQLHPITSNYMHKAGSNLHQIT